MLDLSTMLSGPCAAKRWPRWALTDKVETPENIDTLQNIGPIKPWARRYFFIPIAARRTLCSISSKKARRDHFSVSPLSLMSSCRIASASQL